MADMRIRLAKLGVPDLDGDVLTAEAVHGATGVSVPILPAHRSEHHALGRAWIHAENGYARAELDFNQTPAAQAWKESIRFDFHHFRGPPTQQFSYGFILQGTPERVNGGRGRLLKAIDVVEVSPVVRGASIGSATESAKAHGGALTSARPGYEIKGGGVVERVYGYENKLAWPDRRRDRAQQEDIRMAEDLMSKILRIGGDLEEAITRERARTLLTPNDPLTRSLRRHIAAAGLVI
jgi:hypothetical protein